MADADLKARFEACAEEVRKGDNAPSKPIPNDRKLKVYGLFKQATEGDCTKARPGMLSGFEAGYKWDAWNALKGKSKEDAMREYIAEVAAQREEFA